MQIVKTSAGQFFRVREPTDPALAHVWLGMRLVRKEGAWHDRKGATEILVRKAASVAFPSAPDA